MKHLLTFILLSILTSTHAQVPSYVPTNGLVGWWPFNGNANDESGNANNGTVNGATLTSDRNGVANSAYSFDNNQRIGVFMNNFPVYTISIWARISVWNLGMGFMDGGTLASHKADGLYGNGWALEHNQNQWCWLEYNSNSSNVQQYSGSPQLNNWYHVLLVSDILGNRQLFINGSVVDTYLGGPIISGGNNYEFKIGAHIDGPTVWWFKGDLDDVGYWNRALTECEIQDLYHAQVGFTTVDAGQDQTVCRGTEVTLNGTGGNFLSWNNGVFNGVPFAPNQTSNYVLTGSDSLGCVGSDTVLVTVLDNASSTINQTAIDSYTLNGQTYTQSGTYTQVLTAANGCDSTITLNLELDFTGIQTNSLPSLKLYPNPVQDVLHIEGLASKEFEFEVLSIDGKLLQKGKSQGEIAVKELRKGNYVLRVGQQQVSFVKQ